MIYKYTYKSPIGIYYIFSSETAITGLYHENQKNIPYFQNSEQLINFKSSYINLCITWLNKYFNGTNTDNYSIPVEINGTEFQKKVYKILQSIPYGKTMSYSEVATKISPTMSNQAVGHAISQNPISLIIPCHRVIGKNGQLTGYAGGIENKEYLLKLEKSII